jgi:hypothetical protein
VEESPWEGDSDVGQSVGSGENASAGGTAAELMGGLGRLPPAMGGDPRARVGAPQTALLDVASLRMALP